MRGGDDVATRIIPPVCPGPLLQPLQPRGITPSPTLLPPKPKIVISTALLSRRCIPSGGLDLGAARIVIYRLNRHIHLTLPILSCCCGAINTSRRTDNGVLLLLLGVGRIVGTAIHNSAGGGGS